MLTLDTNLVAKNATTQFLGFEFNSFANFNGRQVGATGGGIFELSGENDNGVPIDAYFEPVMSDFGVGRPKHLRFLYFGFEADGGLFVGVYDDANRSETYGIPFVLDGQQRARVPISRNLHGRYWTFRIGNNAGADFSIDSIHCLYSGRAYGFAQQGA